MICPGLQTATLRVDFAQRAASGMINIQIKTKWNPSGRASIRPEITDISDSLTEYKKPACDQIGTWRLRFDPWRPLQTYSFYIVVFCFCMLPCARQHSFIMFETLSQLFGSFRGRGSNRVQALSVPQTWMKLCGKDFSMATLTTCLTSWQCQP